MFPSVSSVEVQFVSDMLSVIVESAVSFLNMQQLYITKIKYILNSLNSLQTSCHIHIHRLRRELSVCSPGSPAALCSQH